jgi:hypothetical protein
LRPATLSACSPVLHCRSAPTPYSCRKTSESRAQTACTCPAA